MSSNLIVQKYGGTSVGSMEKIRGVAKRIKKSRDAGKDVLVVVSAMAGETDKLLAMDLAAQWQHHHDDVERHQVLVHRGDLSRTERCA